MKRVRRSISALAAGLLMAALCLGQASAAKKQYTFHGKVEAVSKSAKTLRVNGEKVEGWMGAMTMNYKVDNPSIFDRVKPGDEIMATVYDGDYSLHQVKIMGQTTENAKSKK